MKNKKHLLIIILLLIIVAFVFRFLYIKELEKESISSQKVVIAGSTNIEDKVSYKEEIEELRKKNKNNKDIIGILEIENTDFVVPVLQGKDNDYYLNHLPNKKRNFYGSIFLDYRVNIDNSKKLLIFGHNSSRYKMPFYILEKYYDEDYLKEHKYVTIKTENKVRKYELFSIFVETSDFSYMAVKYNKKDYLKHLTNLKKKSMYKIDTEIIGNENILILQTCSTHKKYKNYKKKYLLLSFKEIETIE